MISNLLRSAARSFLPVLFFGLLAPAAAAADPPASKVVTIDRWLVAGPVAMPLPAMLDGSTEPFDLAALLPLEPLPLEALDPAPGDAVALPGAIASVWRETASGEAGTEPAVAGPRVDWAAVRITADRFVKAKLSFPGRDLVRVHLDGKEVAKRDTPVAKDAADPAPLTADLELEPGSHLLVVKALRGAADTGTWPVAATLTQEGADAHATLSLHTGPHRAVSVADLIDTEVVTDVDAAPGGRLVAISYRRPPVDADHVERWVEIVEAATSRVVFSSEGSAPLSSFQWLPAKSAGAEAFSFVEERNGKSTVWRADLAGARRAVLKDVEHFGGYRWLPDGRSLVYSVTEEAKEDERGVHRMQDIPDRWPSFRDVSHLYEASAEPAGGVRRLTGGKRGVSLQDVHPAGTHVLFITQEYGLTARPFWRATLWELELATLAARRVLDTPTFEGASYGPDGETLLVVAGPSFARAAGAAGDALPPAAVPNDYDQRAYLVDRRTGEIDAFTREFDPSVQQAVFAPADGSIYLRAETGSRVAVFRYEPAERRFEEVAGLGEETVDAISVAEAAPLLAWSGSSAGTPPRAFALALADGAAPVEIAAPGADTWNRIEFGRVEDWAFTTADGTRIDGFVHLPPGFDPDAKYPLIVYYYGGTSPTSRSFGGRYPKELWAAHGYVVLSMNPSGATGYGQAFAARHVNDWGATVADEIIAGTRAFLAEHPYVDSARVGCIGASYGGFMTMLLVTRTDLFAAAVSHAGISSISSYWGEGYWGYLYGAIAAADSYPWNRRDVFVDRSPLFAADKVTTPLLLLHGAADTNVPVGESEQMYTALKLLGREVEFLKFAGEDHHIVQHDRRALWTKSILAWFDKHLKDQSGWWDALYGEKK